MPAFAQLRLNLRKALSRVSFSLTITFDIFSHLTSLQFRLCLNTTVRGIFLHWFYYSRFLLFVNQFYTFSERITAVLPGSPALWQWLPGSCPGFFLRPGPYWAVRRRRRPQWPPPAFTRFPAWGAFFLGFLSDHGNQVDFASFGRGQNHYAPVPVFPSGCLPVPAGRSYPPPEPRRPAASRPLPLLPDP